MGRDYSRFERQERRGFAPSDAWDDERDGFSAEIRDRPTRRSGWQGSPVTAYREVDTDDDRDDDRDDRMGWRPRRERPVDWDRERRDARDTGGWQRELGYRDRDRGREHDRERRRSMAMDRRGAAWDEDIDVFGDGDRDEWRGDFGPGEDRTRWGGQRDWESDRAPRGGYYGGGRFGRMDVTRRPAGGWDRDADERREFDRDRDWGRANRSGWNMDRAADAGESHAGRGPRGYQRSDERIREDVSEILWAHHEIDAREIDVHVENGEVTLEGTVDSRWTKRAAEDAAHEARGVHDVHNRLRVRRDGQRQTPVLTGGRERPTPRRATAGAVEMEGGRTGGGLNVAPSMVVVGSDGDEVGQVKEARERDFLVDRPLARDLYIPFSAVEASDGTTVRLRVASGEVDNQGWQQPSMTGTDTDYDQTVELA